MKKIFWVTLLGLGAAAVLGGCPIYGDDGGSCRDGNCESSYCNTDNDCPSGYLCGVNSQCTLAGDASIGGDCTVTGCPSGSVCKLSNGAPACVSSKDGGGDGSTVDSGPGFTGCTSDSQCVTSLGPGALCLNGVCTAPANQCSDGTQCPANEACVSGVCTPTCSDSNPCPTGYSCNTATGVCSGNPTPCGSAGETCTAGTTCVDQHCVAPCGAGNACPTGEVCIDGGCIPSQAPNFVCQTEGQAGDGKTGDCAAGSLCLHHNCYIACSEDAGDACKTADQFNQCKEVTTSSGTYDVCGSTSNLGSECDPTRNLACPSSSQVCIDGYCK